MWSRKYPDGTDRPIAYASRTLSASKRNYAQIEKEGLALIYGAKKFHKYVYGQKFTQATDNYTWFKEKSFNIGCGLSLKMGYFPYGVPV